MKRRNFIGIGLMTFLDYKIIGQMTGPSSDYVIEQFEVSREGAQIIDILRRQQVSVSAGHVWLKIRELRDQRARDEAHIRVRVGKQAADAGRGLVQLGLKAHVEQLLQRH